MTLSGRDMILQIVLVSVVMGTTVAICPHLQTGLTTFNTAGLTKSSNVSITTAVLLDDDLDISFIDISGSGKLVFNRGKAITVKTLGIMVRNTASFIIGSDDCRHTDNVTIIIQGERDTAITHQNTFHEGQKYLATKDQAHLQIHGPDKLHFTKLNVTAHMFNATPASVMFHHQTSTNANKYIVRQGLALYIINGTTLVPSFYKAYDFDKDGDSAVEQTKVNTFKYKLNTVADGDIVAITVQKYLKVGTNTDLNPTFNKIENVAGMASNSLLLRTVQQNDAFSLLFVKGTSNIHQVSDAHIGKDETQALAYIDHGGYKITAISNIVAQDEEQSHIDLRILPFNLGYPTISVIDDISSWNIDDEIIVTSTDFDPSHAERVKIKAKPTSHSITLDRALNYRHFGEIEERVDMRAEVALLTHNIKIQGEMSRGCPVSNGNCEDVPFDSFGAHIKVMHGLGSVFIQGAELQFMGQPTQLGFYPIHFHLCMNVSDKQTIIRRNSIHDTYMRAITVHGTYGDDEEHLGVSLIENVAYHVYGHAYFLEDGIEVATYMDGNLGAVIKGIKNDFSTDLNLASVFWLTNPKVVMINNVAAGAEGNGIWFVFPEEPVGPSTGLIYAKYEAFRTQIFRNDNNVIHSCIRGFYFGRIVLNDKGLLEGYMKRMSLSDPLDLSSTPVKSQVTRMNSYKNWEANYRIRGGYFEFMQCSSAESQQGIRIFRGSNLASFVSKWVFIGVSQGNHEDASYPGATLIPEYLGMVMSAGPVYVSHAAFYGFQPSSLYEAGAIGFKPSVNFFPDSPVTSVTDLRFAFADETGGSRVFGPHAEIYLTGDQTAAFRDADGSVTKCPADNNWTGPVQIVEPEKYLATSACTYREHWEMIACDDIYGKVQVDPRTLYTAATKLELRNTTIRRVRFDDSSSTEFKNHGIQKAAEQEYMLVLQDDSSREFYYELQFEEITDSPKVLRLEGRGIETGLGAVVGMCLPSGVGINDLNLRSRNSEGVVFDHADLSPVSSLADLNSASEMDQYYLNGRMLYFKLVSTVARNPYWNEFDTDDCPTGKCPYFQIKYNQKYTNTPCFSPTYSQLNPTHTINQLGIAENTCTYPAATTVREADWGAGGYMSDQDGVWGEFGSWSECCLGETSTRYRVCDNPSPYGNGASCPGAASQTIACTTVC